MTSEVTQAARDAVADLMTNPTMSFWYGVDVREDIQRGRCDNNAFVQAFAKFERETLARLTAQSGEKLFHAIKYGDDEHRAWLKDAIEAFFAGRSVPAPRGEGKKDAEIKRLTALLKAQSGEGRSGAGEDGLSAERKAVLQNPRVNDAIQTALERGELTVTVDGYLAALTARQSGEGEREGSLAIVECSDPNEGWSLSIKFGSGDQARDRMRALSDRLRAGDA
jgi:hypothetical protein